MALTACHPQSQPQADPLAASGAEDCLLVVWERDGRANAAFDRAHDRASGGAVSCATGGSASSFDAALSAIRAAAATGDRAGILREVGIPLLYIDENGVRRELTEPGAVDAAFEEVFSPEVVDLLSRVRLEDMQVVDGQGAFFGLGALWLVVDDSGRPRIVTVNAQALGEAAAAAKRKAQAGEADPAPLAAE